MPRWIKGQTGNPQGRPKHDRTFTDALRAKGTPGELAALAWKAARDGAPWAIQMIFNRLEPPSAQVNISQEKSNATPNDSPPMKSNSGKDYLSEPESELRGLKAEKARRSLY